MNLSELNVKEEWAYYNKVAPFQTYLLNGNELKYRYYKKDDAKATIVVLAGGSGLADGFFLFLRSYGGLLAQIIAKKYPDVVSGLLLTSTASFSTELTFAGMKCIVNMINEEKEEKRVEKYKKMPMGLAMAMFPMMFKPHLKGDKKAYKTIKELIKILEPEMSKEHFVHMTRLLGDLRNHFGLYNKGDFEYLKGRALIIEPVDDKTFTEDIKKALCNMMTEPKVIDEVDGGHLAIMFNPNGYIKLIDDFISNV